MLGVTVPWHFSSVKYTWEVSRCGHGQHLTNPIFEGNEQTINFIKTVFAVVRAYWEGYRHGAAGGLTA